MKSLYKIFQTFSSISRTIPKPCLLMKSRHIPLSSYSLHFRQYCSATTTKVPNTPTGDSGESSSSSSEESDETEAEMDLRVSILEASLPFVHTSGWSSESLSREFRLFKHVTWYVSQMVELELVNHFFKKCNDKLENEMKERANSGKYSGRTPVSTTTFISDAVEFRLRMNIEYIDTWAKALALHASPNNWSTAFDNVTTIIDTIWYYAGDKICRLLGIARRGSLLLIYKSTELCLLQDKSEDYKDTWSFLSRRLNEAESLEKFVNFIMQSIIRNWNSGKSWHYHDSEYVGFQHKVYVKRKK
ncbi:Ubiquinone biosynthesis protein COQ9, mitochondrial [Armadillidium nasatum]|uniref:Ubiquinone biosynthesis protein n=1 Tax=Armadillidium nasatum TaxID=96803 RepID=A0A5N5T0K6_9CRUS|nr:Ubiquinone biosynthesis protein COQ9, mitochondrial [Armadillidium nasatum]